MADLSSYTTVFRAKINNPGSNGSPRRVLKRTRNPVSCTACRSRKGKCDRQAPCGACARRGDGDACWYPAGAADRSFVGNGSAATNAGRMRGEIGSDYGGNGGNGANGALQGGAGGGKLEAQLRLQRLEELVNELMSRSADKVAATPASLDSTNDSSGPPGRTTSLAHMGFGSWSNDDNEGGDAAARRQQQQQQQQQQRQQLGHSTNNNSNKEHLAGLPEIQVSNLIGEAPFIGAAHWAAVLESIRDIQGYLDAEMGAASAEDAARGDDDQAAALPAPPQDPSDMPDSIIFAKPEPPPGGMREIQAALPTRPECDHLLGTYFQMRYITGPFVHGPAFQRAYNAFWADPEGTSLLWVSMLCSILAIASTIAAAKETTPTPLPVAGDGAWGYGRGSGRTVFTTTSTSENVQTSRLRSLAARCLVAGEFLKARPFAVEALIMCAFCKIALTKDADPKLWSTFGVVVRLAQRMGYHRDPRHLGPKITAFEGEMRRRTWYIVETFDLLYSFQVGMPTIIHEDETDTDHPTNLLDEDFDEDSPVLPPARPFTDPTPVLYFCFKSRHIRLLRRIIRHVLTVGEGAWSSTAPDYGKTLAMDAELREVHASVPPSLKIRKIRDSAFSDAPHQIMQRLTVELMYLKAQCVLHRAFLTYGKDDPAYEKSRDACRGAAMRILDLHAEFEEETGPGGRLVGEKHLMNSLTLHDFLLAATILCLDLTESVLSPDDKARKFGALQRAYTIWNGRKNTSRDAAHAARVLGVILKKLNVGDDPWQTTPSITLQTDSVDIARAAASTWPEPMTMTFSIGENQTYDWSGPAPFDDVLSDPNNIDWNAVDSYLLDRGVVDVEMGENVWSAELMAEGP